MEKLVLEKDKDDFYILEVNDEGETIQFDLTDIGLPERIMKASDKVLEIDKEYKKRFVKINDEFKDNEEKITREIINLELEQCMELRKLFDSFLGEGACQKIFGDKNNYYQFNILMEQLEPHFEKMKLKLTKAKQKLVQKYMPKDNDVI